MLLDRREKSGKIGAMKKSAATRPWVAYWLAALIVAAGTTWVAITLYVGWYAERYNLTQAELAEDYALGFRLLLLLVITPLGVLLLTAITTLVRSLPTWLDELHGRK